MNPIRIKTFVGSVKIYTLYLINNWVTIISGQEINISSDSFLEAAQNHLQVCLQIKKLSE